MPRSFAGAGIVMAGLLLAVTRSMAVEVEAQSLDALRQLVEQQSRKIDELSSKIQQLEARQNLAETNAAQPRLPAIVIDTNGVPVNMLAAETGHEPMTNRPAMAQLMAGPNGFTLRSADTNFIFTLHGLVQQDFREFFEDNSYNAGNSGFLLRRARPIFEGTVFRDYDFLITPDFGGSSVQLYDAYIHARLAPEFQVKAGKFKGPVSLENLQSDAAAPFNERSFVCDLAPPRNIGIQLGGDLALGPGQLNWAAGIYDTSGDGRLPGNNPAGEDPEFGGRLFWQPFKFDPEIVLHGLGFGVGGSYSEVSSNSAALPATTGGSLPGYWTAGQQQFFAYNPVLGAVVADGPHWRLSPQASYFLGPFGVQAEYIISHQRVLNSTTLRRASLEHSAWQMSAQWMLTGEDASFGAIKPSHPFGLHHGGWGAWQLVGRLSQLDIDSETFNGFSDATTSARSAAAWSIGLNWWLNANVRWLLSFSQTTFQGGGGVNPNIPSTTTAPATVSAQDENVLFTRIQIAF